MERMTLLHCTARDFLKEMSGAKWKRYTGAFELQLSSKLLHLMLHNSGDRRAGREYEKVKTSNERLKTGDRIVNIT